VNKLFIVVYLLFIMTCVSLFIYNCGKSSSSSVTGTNSSVSNVSTIDDFSNIITIRKGTKVVLDSPEKVIQLWILFNIEQRKWFKEIADRIGKNNTNVDLDDKSIKFLEDKKNEFYKQYGLTEKDMIQYNKIHSKDIYDFMEQNPKYKKAYDQTM